VGHTAPACRPCRLDAVPHSYRSNTTILQADGEDEDEAASSEAGEEDPPHDREALYNTDDLTAGGGAVQGSPA
jgi:hypothetical protein